MTNNKPNIEELIAAQRFIVEAVAKQYKDRGLTMEQLIAEGNKGLVKADERFVQRKGFMFMTCAVVCIRQSILEALAATENGEPLDQWHPVLTARERGILRDIADGEILEQIAEERRLTVERVRQIRELAQRKLNRINNKNQDNG